MTQRWRRISGIAVATLAHLGMTAGCTTKQVPTGEQTEATEGTECEGLLILAVDSVRLEWAGGDCTLEGHIVQQGTSRELSCTDVGTTCGCELQFADGALVDFREALTLELVLNESTEFTVDGESLKARLAAAPNACSGRTVDILETEGVPIDNGLGGFGGEGSLP